MHHHTQQIACASCITSIAVTQIQIRKAHHLVVINLALFRSPEVIDIKFLTLILSNYDLKITVPIIMHIILQYKILGGTKCMLA